MKINESFYMLEIHSGQGKNRTKEIILYDNLDESVKKVAEYMIEGVSTENIELTEVSIQEEGIKAKVISWSTLAESIVKILKSK